MVSIDRRRYKRYPVSGRAKFQAGITEGDGDVLDIGSGGILIRSPVGLSQGTELKTLFTIQGYASEFSTSGRMVRAQLGVLAVMFLQEPVGLWELLKWLETAEGSQANP